MTMVCSSDRVTAVDLDWFWLQMCWESLRPIEGESLLWHCQVLHSETGYTQGQIEQQIGNNGLGLQVTYLTPESLATQLWNAFAIRKDLLFYGSQPSEGWRTVELLLPTGTELETVLTCIDFVTLFGFWLKWHRGSGLQLCQVSSASPLRILFRWRFHLRAAAATTPTALFQLATSATGMSLIVTDCHW